MNTLSTVEALLRAYCSNNSSRATQIDPRYAQLWQEIERYLLAGGKRMRPRLVLMAYDAYKKTHTIDITPVAAAWELLHGALLIHDDIIDRDTIRHGQPNIAGRYQDIYGALSSSDTSHYALSAGLLAGDLLLMGADELITSAAILSEAKLLALSYIHQAVFIVAGGELIDTDSALYSVADSNPESIIKHKTASYSLQLPLQCGAALAGAPSEELEKLHALGLHVGTAFQLRDDLLGIFGDSTQTGKSNRSDIIEKKRTFLIRETIKTLNQAQSDRLLSLFAPDHLVTSDEAEEIVRLIADSGAKETTERTIEQESSKGLAVVEALDIEDAHKQHFIELIKKLTTRTS